MYTNIVAHNVYKYCGLDSELLVGSLFKKNNPYTYFLFTSIQNKKLKRTCN